MYYFNSYASLSSCYPPLPQVPMRNIKCGISHGFDTFMNMLTLIPFIPHFCYSFLLHLLFILIELWHEILPPWFLLLDHCHYFNGRCLVKFIPIFLSYEFFLYFVASSTCVNMLILGGSILFKYCSIAALTIAGFAATAIFNPFKSLHSCFAIQMYWTPTSVPRANYGVALQRAPSCHVLGTLH